MGYPDDSARRFYFYKFNCHLSEALLEYSLLFSSSVFINVHEFVGLLECIGCILASRVTILLQHREKLKRNTFIWLTHSHLGCTTIILRYVSINVQYSQTIYEKMFIESKICNQYNRLCLEIFVNNVS